MRSIHEKAVRCGVSLTYDAPTGTGKTTPHTDTYYGRFVKLVPNENSRRPIPPSMAR
jgi:hypothetical protein